MTKHGAQTQEELIQTTIQRMNARAWGIAMGLLLGGGIFIATNILVLKGGQNVGRHLRLLAVYFPGYRVTFLGSLLGFVYAFVLGYGLGRLVGMVYNQMVGTDRRQLEVL